MSDDSIPVQTQVDNLAMRLTAAESLVRSLLTVLEEVAGSLNDHLGYVPEAQRPQMPTKLGAALLDDEGLIPFPAGMAVVSAEVPVSKPCFHAPGGMPPVIDALAEAARQRGPGGKEYEGDAACGFVEAGERLKGREG